MKPAFQPYDSKFFDDIADHSLQSARVVAPLVLELFPAKSVVDVGCGQGAWLRGFHENGVEEIRGFDGSYVDREKLLIDVSCFTEIDLSTANEIPGRYDLAMCLEVGEHLPARSAPRLVQLLTRAAPVVLFSAAVPGQGGTCHVNEQWPCYWAKLFANHGYVRLDPIRRQVFANEGVAWWYRQNIFVYVLSELVGKSALLQEEMQLTNGLCLEVIHPLVLSRFTSLRGLLGQLPGAVWRCAKKPVSFRLKGFEL